MNKSRDGQHSHHRFAWSMIALVALIAATLVTAPLASAQEPPARNFFGTIVSIEDNVLQVITKDGELLDVTVSDDTAIVLPLKPNAALSDVVEGDVVAISLTDDDSPLVADKIFVISTQTKHKHIPGEVISKTDTQITIKPPRDMAEPVTFNITPGTKINFRRGAIALDVGSFVIVLAVRDSNTGTLSPDAIEINVAPGRPVPPPQTKPVEGPANKAKIRGVFQEIDEEDNWIVNNIKVVVDTNTEIESGLVIGQVVEVVGQLMDDGSILAREIEAVEEVSHGPERLRFEGIFEGVDDNGNWIISGTPVIVRSGIDINGRPSIGQPVKVKAVVLEDDSIVAREIEIVRNVTDDDDLDEKRLEGAFQGVDADGKWIISQIKVAVDENTELENAPEIGDRVKVKAIILDDGTFLAREIEVEDRDEDRDDDRKEVEFRGVIRRVFEEGGTIVGIEVREHRIRIVELTEVRGTLRAGLLAKVEALLMEDGTLIAREIETRRIDIPGIGGESKVEIRGIIQRMSDNGALIQVNGIVIAIEIDTRVDGNPTVGAPISVEGVLKPDGTVRAVFIKVFSIEEVKEKVKEKVRGMIDEVIRDEDGNIIAVIVDGKRIRIEALTRLETALRTGAIVEIEGILSDAGLLAQEIDEEDDSSGNQRRGSNSGNGNSNENPSAVATSIRLKLEGVIEAMERRANLTIGFIWVNGHKITVTGITEMKGEVPAVGSFAEVEARRNGGVIIATKIDVEKQTNVRDNSGSASDDDDDREDNSGSNSGSGSDDNSSSGRG